MTKLNIVTLKAAEYLILCLKHRLNLQQVTFAMNVRKLESWMNEYRV